MKFKVVISNLKEKGKKIIDDFKKNNNKKEKDNK